jgi:hypothetical protein
VAIPFFPASGGKGRGQSIKESRTPMKLLASPIPYMIIVVLIVLLASYLL